MVWTCCWDAFYNHLPVVTANFSAQNTDALISGSELIVEGLALFITRGTLVMCVVVCCEIFPTSLRCVLSPVFVWNRFYMGGKFTQAVMWRDLDKEFKSKELLVMPSGVFLRKIVWIPVAPGTQWLESSWFRIMHFSAKVKNWLSVKDHVPCMGPLYLWPTLSVDTLRQHHKAWTAPYCSHSRWQGGCQGLRPRWPPTQTHHGHGGCPGLRPRWPPCMGK